MFGVTCPDMWGVGHWQPWAVGAALPCLLLTGACGRNLAVLLRQEVTQIVTHKGAHDTFSSCGGVPSHIKFFFKQKLPFLVFFGRGGQGGSWKIEALRFWFDSLLICVWRELGSSNPGIHKLLEMGLTYVPGPILFSSIRSLCRFHTASLTWG